MNNETSLLVVNYSTLTAAFTAEAEKLKAEALSTGALIGRVSDARENAAAVEAQKSLQGFLAVVEKARKAAKEKPLELGRQIDAKAAEIATDVKGEMLRISGLVGSFQQLEQKRFQAEVQARNQKLLEIERERAAALSKATTEAQQDAVNEHFAVKAQVAAPPPSAPTRAEGQRVTQDWEITVTNPYELAKFHPQCVKIEPNLLEIKTLLNIGVEVHGVVAKRVTKASVSGGTRKAIEV